MTASPAATLPDIRTNNLALAFQEVFTVILRTRFFLQRVDNADTFRATLRKMISAAVKDCSAMGYSDEASKMAIYAMIGFLDESVLNSKDPTFADWARRPLQEEMFGGHFAGEYFFRTVNELLNRPESAEVADVLELHALCLLLGYRGRFAFGDASEIHTILHRLREKIFRIRGTYSLFRPMETPSAPPAPKRDPWVGRLAITAIVLAVVTVLAYVGYILMLGQAIPTTAGMILRPDFIGTTKQAAEKGLFEGKFQPQVLQGLKPDVDFIGVIGPAEAVPLLQSLRKTARMSFSAACKVMPGYKVLRNSYPVSLSTACLVPEGRFSERTSL